MKTASLVLGIIAGVLAIIFGIIFMLSGALINYGTNYLDEVSSELEDMGWEVDVDVTLSDAGRTVATGATLIGIFSIVGAILGIIGGALAKKKGVLAGIFMIVAAIPSFFTGVGFIASILFIVGAILAFIPEKSADKPVAA